MDTTWVIWTPLTEISTFWSLMGIKLVTHRVHIVEQTSVHPVIIWYLNLSQTFYSNILFLSQNYRFKQIMLKHKRQNLLFWKVSIKVKNNSKAQYFYMKLKLLISSFSYTHYFYWNTNWVCCIRIYMQNLIRTLWFG